MNTKYLIIGALLCASAASAQSPVSGFMNQKGKGAVVVSYSSEKYNEVFLVPEKVNGVPIFNEVQNTSVNLYATYGLSNKLEMVLGLPYIQSKGQGEENFMKANNFSNSRSGLQDLSFFLKYKLISTKIGSASLDVLATAGIQTPLGSYKVDEGLQSIIAIGNRSTKFTPMGIVHLKTESGLFATGQLGYSLRNNRVPNAVVSELKAGYAGSKVYLDAWVARQTSVSGTDILQSGFDGFFPATRVNYTRVGANIFAPIAGGIGAVVGVNSYLEGRNLGKSTGFSVGLVLNY